MIVARGKRDRRRRNPWDGEDWAAWGGTTFLVLGGGFILYWIGFGLVKAWRAAPEWVGAGAVGLLISGVIAAWIIDRWGPNS